ncbi:MAG: c-type cytochrome [Planctomycetes bacterium]|nr:c-type cytochrome [Planctomycetota bacterium]
MPLSIRPVNTLFFVFASLIAINVSRSAEVDEAQQAQDTTIVETVLRLEGFDLNSSPKAKAAVLRHLQTQRGTPRYLELVERFELRETADELLKLAIEKPADTVGVGAARLLLKFKQTKALKKAIDGKDQTAAVAIVTALGHVGGKEAQTLILPLVTAAERGLPIRSAAAIAVGRNLNGQRELLALVVAKKLPEDLNFSVANILHASLDEKIRAQAIKLLKLPQTAGSKPLPPVSALVKLRGNAARGKALFAGKATCAKCHTVRGAGKEVGPDLSEIGSKLSREALYVSILDPSAAISHNYETYLLATADGNVLSGILLSQTKESVTIKTAEAIVRRIPADQIEAMKKQKVSLMPVGLVKALTPDDLVDVVEYLRTLKKPAAQK